MTVPDTVQYKVLFVCMGNICRSPTAEGVFRRHVEEAGLGDLVHVDSAGTHAYHVGEGADRRALAAAERRGYSLAGIRARRVTGEDFQRFDLLLAMDGDNLAHLRDLAEAGQREKARLFLTYGSREMTEVPDPYYGGSKGFEHVLDLIEDAASGLLVAVRNSVRTS